MKRTWFTTQRQYDYMPLRAGLGLIDQVTFEEYILMGRERIPKFPVLCSKIYTTRRSPMWGEYYVVEGSRYKAEPVKPRIEFRVRETYWLDLASGELRRPPSLASIEDLGVGGLTFPEIDLGIRGATFQELRDVLLKLNRGSTLETPFFINKLEPIREEKVAVGTGEQESVSIIDHNLKGLEAVVY